MKYQKSFSNNEFSVHGTGSLLFELNNGVTIDRASFIKEMKQFDATTGVAKNYYKGSDGGIYEAVAEPVDGFYHTTSINKVDCLEYDRNIASSFETEFEVAGPKETADAFQLPVKDGADVYNEKSAPVLKLFLHDQNSLISELMAPEQNAIYLALYEKMRTDGLEKEQAFDAVENIMQLHVLELENHLNVTYMDRKRKNEPDVKSLKLIPQIVIPGSDLDIKTYLGEEDLKRSVKRLLEDDVLRVERLRGSATQGEAAVYCNEKKIVQYGDKICLLCKDGNWLDAMADKKILDSSLEQGEYGPMIGNYRRSFRTYDRNGDMSELIHELCKAELYSIEMIIELEKKMKQKFSLEPVILDEKIDDARTRTENSGSVCSREKEMNR